MKLLEPNSLIIVGASTGGPNHIREVLSSLSHNHQSTIIIAQHMGSEYIPIFAKRLQNFTPFDVVVAEDKEILEARKIYIMSNLCTIVSKYNQLQFSILYEKNIRYNPEINPLLLSCQNLDLPILAIILTGIGDDGADGIKALCNKKNTTCLAESEESAIVYGMPMRARDVSQKVKVQSLEEIIQTINSFGV